MRALVLLALGLLVCLWTPTVEARGKVSKFERITSFHSDITILSDSALRVVETIKVVSTGDQIKRGIYRDFPTKYEDQFGNHFTVGFTVDEVWRDGLREPYVELKQYNGVRVRIGREDRLLDRGEHVYEIHYRTTRQLGFFDEHDELYWNVTGNGWVFGIEEASATVLLPRTVESNRLRMIGYTGPFGSTEQEYASETGVSSGVIQTTRPLNAGEGLTLVFSFPKGIIEEPSFVDNLFAYISDNAGLLFALVVTLLSAGYLYFVWRRVGRDPKPGVIYARYEPVVGYSPGAIRYVTQMGYDERALTAEILQLAVKGHLRIHESKNYRLELLPSDAPLTGPEEVLLRSLFQGRAEVTLTSQRHAFFKARREHEKRLTKDYRLRYFRTNGILVLPTAILIPLTFFFVATTWEFTFLGMVLLMLNFLQHILYLILMRAPTQRGRELLDAFEGFKLYLKVAEGDALLGIEPSEALEKTPELFESHLPYAVALGVENEWEKKFRDILAAPREHSSDGVYSADSWYSGWRSGAGFGSGLVQGLGSQISSSGVAPGTSGAGGFSSGGGGGGGSSGGGGGGGGGGGW